MRSLLVRRSAGAIALCLASTLVFAGGPAAAAGPTDPLAGARFVPLPTQGPSWYDLAYHRRVLASGTEGVPLPDGVEAPAAAGLVAPGIRPGQWLVTLRTSPFDFVWCSANFVFTNGTAYGVGTAGHCADPNALGTGEVTAYVVPPAGRGAPGFYPIGRFVLARNYGIGDDFAMVQVYSEFSDWVNPTMPVWGGPIGVYGSDAPAVVQHFGHGMVVGTGGTPRAGVAPVWTARNRSAFAWYGAGSPGDSGSGVRVATGEAAGNFTHIVIFDGTRPGAPLGEILPGMLAGTRMTKILQSAPGWTLVNGKLLAVP